MDPIPVLILIMFVVLSVIRCKNDDSTALTTLGPSMDPSNTHLFSWTDKGGPCGGVFVGTTCDGGGRVANISLESMNLTGKISPAISNLSQLTGIFLHYNSLYGEIPEDLWRLTNLKMLYLNHNFFSGSISHSIGNMVNLEVLELGYNQLTGSIPPTLGLLIRISILSLTSNQLTGTIPEKLGDIGMLIVLDLSRNNLSGRVPLALQNAHLLQFVDIRNNSLTGRVPSGLNRLGGSFLYQNNSGLCGARFRLLKSCSSVASNPDKVTVIQPQAIKIPSCNQTSCSNGSPAHHAVVIVVLTSVLLMVSFFIGLLMLLSRQRRQKQRLSGYSDSADIYHSSEQGKEVYLKSGAAVGTQYTSEKDFIPDSIVSGGFSQEVLEGYRFSLEEVETATQCFSEVNLLGKNKFSGVHKGVLKDGSPVAIKSVSIGNCKSNEFEFLDGLSILVHLRHNNLVRLRGFCCSRGRGECFLVHDFIPNGTLSSYLDLKDGDARVLEWPTRVRIVNGIARGVEFLHNQQKPALLHQNISSEKVLLDKHMNPLLSDAGLQKLLTSDIIFSVRKGSAAMGYLAPEYTMTGRFTDKSDVYAFGMLVFQILSGRRAIPGLILRGGRTHNIQEYMDPNLHGSFVDHQVTKLVGIAQRCVNESSLQRPSMEALVKELDSC